MLIKLLPQQIAKMWDVIRLGVVQTWPVATEQRSENIRQLLQSLLSETVQCWIGKEGDDFYGLVITKICICDVTGSKSLNIMTLFGFKVIPEGLWEQSVESLRKFARENNCKYITATSNNPKVLKICKRFKFEQTQFLSLEV